MAGTIPLSLTQQLDVYGAPLAGGLLYLYQAGTVGTPQNAYQDTALTIPLPNPITLDAAGRIPQFFLADGQIKIRLQDVNGVVQLAADNILVIGPSAGGGGGAGAVDPTTVMQTGDLKVRYDTSIISGFVRCNGKTIGSATSAGSELADPSAQALFNYLWGKDPNLPVYQGSTQVTRGASASADWSANRSIATPDWRGYALGALDGMGNTLAGRLTSAYFGAANADALGAVGGGESFTLAVAQLPNAAPTGSVASTFSGTVPIPVRNYVNSGSSDTTRASLGSNVGTDAGNLNITPSGTVTSTLTMNALGNGNPLRTIGPRKLCTFYIKL
jgi:hypothetical protein